MTRHRGLLAGASVLGMVLLGSVAFAAPQRATIELVATPAAKVEQGYLLTARIRTADGKPVNEATTRFYEAVDLIGPREMLIGTVVTDGQGQGMLGYLPAQLGAHQIIARTSGSDLVAAAEGRVSFDASVAAAEYQVQPVPLAGFSAVVTGVVGAIVLVVWILIAFALISTARGVRRGARDLGSKGNLA